MSEDDVLSEVEPDSVPNEVRNWLSMTFTRSVTSMKKKVEEIEKTLLSGGKYISKAGYPLTRKILIERREVDETMK